jgi:hypothetical protein
MLDKKVTRTLLPKTAALVEPQPVSKALQCSTKPFPIRNNVIREKGTGLKTAGYAKNP